MTRIPLSKEVITSRLTEIEKNLTKLKSLSGLAFEEFNKGENFAIAEHYLRRTLMYNIIQDNLKDIEQFIHYIGLVLENPQKFNLEVK